MKIRIVCFGDSNTWGYIPGTDHERYDETIRFPKVLQSLLGNSYEIIEEGLNSRTLVSDDPRPGKEGRNGSVYLYPCLQSHDPLDMVILMMGTNELKHRFGYSAMQVGELLETYYIQKILSTSSQFQEKFPKLILVAPPCIEETKEYAKLRFEGGTKKSQQFALICQLLAKKYSCSFVDASDLQTGSDGVHLLPESHHILAKRISILF